MKVRVLALLTLALLATNPGVSAQEYEFGQLWDVQVIKVKPAHIDEFMGAVAQIKEAAQAANLGQEYQWHIWVRDFDVAIASPATNMASFDDPGAWMRQFQGTAGEEILNVAMGRLMTEIGHQPVSREVWEQVSDWSYAPENVPFDMPGQYAERHDFWVRPEMSEEFDAVAKSIMALLGEMGGDYPVTGFRRQFGDAGLATFIVHTDNWSEYYGEKSLEAGLEATGRAAEWEEIMALLRDCVTDAETSQMEYMAALSYTGPGM